MEINPITGPPLPAGHIRIRNAEGGVQFPGELLATSSSDNTFRPDKLKWTELELYRKTDGIGLYVLHVIARSVVYHTMNGCGNGVPVKIADLSRHYLDTRCAEPIPEPCTYCKPPDISAKLRDSDLKVMAEVDWHAVYQCDTVRELFASLKQTKGKNVGQFGMPARILLVRASQFDPELAAALNEVRSI